MVRRKERIRTTIKLIRVCVLFWRNRAFGCKVRPGQNRSDLRISTQHAVSLHPKLTHTAKNFLTPDVCVCGCIAFGVSTLYRQRNKVKRVLLWKRSKQPTSA